MPVTVHRTVTNGMTIPGLPVAVPGIFLAAGAASSSADRGHSFASLALPPAALGSFPWEDK